MMLRVPIVVECARCHDALRADVDVIDCEEHGCYHPAKGTLSGNWLLSWIRAHQEPQVFLANCPHEESA